MNPSGASGTEAASHMPVDEVSNGDPPAVCVSRTLNGTKDPQCLIFVCAWDVSQSSSSGRLLRRARDILCDAWPLSHT